MGHQHLIHYDAMILAIAKCHGTDEILSIAGKARQLEAAARVAKDTEGVKKVTEIRVRAERRLGQLLEETPKNKGGDPVPHRNRVDEPPTLAALGIDRKLSMRAQQLAKVPAKQFEAAVSVAREVAAEVTAHAILHHQKLNIVPVSDAKVVVRESRAKDNDTHIFELFGALDVLAKFPIPAPAIRRLVLSYQRHRIDNNLDGAISYLLQLKKQWGTQ